MKTTEIVSVFLAILYLFAYTLLAAFADTQSLALKVFLCSPILVGVLMYIVHRKGNSHGFH